ncbi:hypothetical protein [Amycolatopsis sp. lyj-346]|uniref:hypothetical protein n=1 Tax=Amycolatopsis sp. lyj-346 TaxID=2789289 RepID=UPI00397CD913
MLSPSEGRDPVLSAVTLIVGIIVALTFLFGFGNVLTSLNLILIGGAGRSVSVSGPW